MPHRSLISIIDDDAYAREGIKALIMSLGYQALAFATAEDFLNSTRVDDTACIISDVQMPGLSGFDLQQRLQTREHSPPVIFVTAYPEDRHRQRAMSAGAVGFLAKPFEEQTLIDCLALAIKAKRADVSS